MSDAIANFWHGMVNAVQNATAVLVIAGGLAIILGILLYSLFGIKKANVNLVIIVSTVLSCVLMVPVISSFNYLVKTKIEGAIIDEGRAEIRALRDEAARMQLVNERWFLELETLGQRIAIGRQTVEMQTLNDSIRLLEHAQFSIQSFQRILELALSETNLKQTLVRKEPVDGTLQSGRYDEALVIITYDITAKYGIDLNEVKVAKINETTVAVSGIKSKFIGASRDIADPFLKEIRRVERSGGVDTVRVQNDSANIQRANQFSDTFTAEFRRRLYNGTELGFMDEAVTQLAQNFIRVMLAPLYRNITFDNINRADSLPLMEHLERELRETNARRLELDEINSHTEQSDRQLENEIEQIDSIEDYE